MFGKGNKEVLKMLVYITFPVIMFGIFNSPWFYEDAMYQARRALQSKRDVTGGLILREAIAEARKKTLEKEISQREKNFETD